ncbi:MAG: type II toxin-antitoxin system VapC family toxin [Actinomycetota bacterium]|nr:type II toxin-antitoxin system VapC family toxin [Rubrobacter sp.]MDQ3507030.1 type II toxin-antitoxin system VapC family toxin [Actinomycetota bacterium]
MYAAGRDHPLKNPSVEILSRITDHPALFFTSAEVLQEIFHRYLSLGRLEDGRGILTRFAKLMRGRIEPIHGEDVERAASLAENYAPALSARDLLHAVVMLRTGAERIASADGDFDIMSAEGIVRLDPMDVEEWGGEISSGESGA